MLNRSCAESLQMALDVLGEQVEEALEMAARSQELAYREPLSPEMVRMRLLAVRNRLDLIQGLYRQAAKQVNDLMAENFPATPKETDQ